LGGEELGLSVAKVVVPDLEDPPESRHRRFGRRAVSAMLETV
jgi:ribosomal protein S12 methylthiotransferase accessory factor YcaO